VITVLESSRNYRNSMRRMLVSSGGRGLLPGRGGMMATGVRSGGRAVYRWIKNRSEGVKISLAGGSAPVKDRLEVAAESWGGLWKGEPVKAIEFPQDRMDPITWGKVEAVVYHLPDGKSQGTDSWSPAELRALTKGQLKAMAHILNRVEVEKRWPEGMGPIVAFIPMDVAESEGQRRSIAILPYVYRVWMAVWKRRANKWVLELHGGSVRAPEDLVWEVAARAEVAKASGRFHTAYFDCSKCYERVRHDIAIGDGLETGRGPTIVALCFAMYGEHKTISAHGADVRGIHADRGLLAGCGFAVHYLKAMMDKEG